MVRASMTCEGTPGTCKGALGTWPLQESPDMVGPANHGAPVEAHHTATGCTWVSAEAACGMGRRREGSQGQNRTGENPPSGIVGGPAETWTRVELGTHLAYRKSKCWSLSTYRCARRRSIPTVPERGDRYVRDTLSSSLDCLSVQPRL